ncbi:hypothetical protein L218DRAFT_656533 [Marasmius fiardii PR-910]|nr:hypothetical protein L218DRAFT_656533 [Marasmius fiardii PR-910]
MPATVAPSSPPNSAPRKSPGTFHNTEMNVGSEDGTPHHKPNGFALATTSTSHSNSTNGTSHLTNGIIKTQSNHGQEVAIEHCRNSISSLLLQNIRLRRSASNNIAFQSNSHGHSMQQNVKELLSNNVCKAFMEKAGEVKSQLRARGKMPDHPYDNQPRPTPTSHLDPNQRGIMSVEHVATTSSSLSSSSVQERHQDDVHPRTARKRSRPTDDEPDGDHNHRTSRPRLGEFGDSSARPTSHHNSPPSRDRDGRASDGTPSRSRHDTRSLSLDSMSNGRRRGDHISSHDHPGSEHDDLDTSSDIMLKNSVHHRDEQGHSMLNELHHSVKVRPFSDKQEQSRDAGQVENNSSSLQTPPWSAKPNDVDSGPSTSNTTSTLQTPAISNMDSGNVQTHNQPQALPCHNVPGLWLLKPALSSPGILDCTFQIDIETVQKWQINTEYVISLFSNGWCLTLAVVQEKLVQTQVILICSN